MKEEHDWLVALAADQHPLLRAVKVDLFQRRD